MRSALMSASLAVGATIPALAMDRSQGPEGLRRGVEHRDRIGFDRHIAFERDGAAAVLGDRRDDSVSRLGVLAIIDSDRPSVLGGEQRAGAADAARSAGDNEGLGGHAATSVARRKALRFRRRARRLSKYIEKMKRKRVN
jgi:hypothetical protein